MPRRSVNERQTFRVELGHPLRRVTKNDGKRYYHRCSLESYTAVAHCVEEHADQGVTTPLLWDALPDVPCTQASVALAFMKERGCQEARYRRLFPMSHVFFEDAMLEWHALEHATAAKELASQAESAQQANAWSTAASLWRQAAGSGEDEAYRDHCLKQAAWCEDMNTLRQEDESV